MFSNLLRQHTRLVLCARIPHEATHHNFLKHVPTLITQKFHVLPHRTFSICRTLLEDASTSPSSSPAQVPRDDPDHQTNDKSKFHRIIYVGNVASESNESDLLKLFLPYGEAQKILLIHNNVPHVPGCAYIEFKDRHDAVNAVLSGQKEPFSLADRSLRVEIAKSRPRQWRPKVHSLKKDGSPYHVLHIPNYPSPGDDTLIRKLLEKYEDNIVTVRFMQDLYGNATSKAFVEFTDIETATTALNEFEGQEILGTPLHFYYARPRLTTTMLGSEQLGTDAGA